MVIDSKQVSFRLRADLMAKLELAAKYEDLSVADFVRKIFRIGFERYEQLGSLQALREAAANDQAKTGAKRRRPS